MTATSCSFHPGAIWADDHGVHINAHGGGILFHEGVYYWFGEHKIAGDAGNVAHVGVHCYSSRDLYHWTDEGIALPVVGDATSEIAAGCILERPKVLFNRHTGKFVMWFHLELIGAGYTAARSGVAIADCPTGPYRYLGSLRPNVGYWPQNVPEELKTPLTTEESTMLAGMELYGGAVPDYPETLIFRRDFAKGQMARDMALFLDDDGIAYHIYASEDNGTLHISQLSEDFCQSSGRYVRVFPGGFNEAPALFKRRGTYYMITSGCTGWVPNAARLAMAESIWGPWVPLGNPCEGTAEQQANTFASQSTYVLPVAGLDDAFIFLADRWQPENAIDGRYIWLPIIFRDERPVIAWRDSWDLSVFVK